jgi:sulfite dehydrogenase (cytochrome) subunit B
MQAKKLCALVVAFVVAMAAAGSACAVTKIIQIPPDSEQLTPSALPGYAKAKVNCVACHSAEYMVYQPPTAPRGYWETMVKRMKVVFKAPVADEDMPEIIDYLVKTYGNERPK